MYEAISIIVPTVNEAGNLPALLRRIANSLKQDTNAKCAYEVLVIDDGSTDGTPQVCRSLSQDYPVTVHQRSRPIGGLSGAVLCGFAVAKGDILVAMDADLQHPPEALPSLIAPLRARTFDFVIGSRRAPGGTIVGPWSLWRRSNSAIARWMAAPLARGVRDPLSGFFAIRRTTVEAARSLNPLGFKIGLELMCKCPIDRVLEIPIEFGTRYDGDTKLTVTQQVNYVRHLGRLYLRRLLHRPVRSVEHAVEESAGGDEASGIAVVSQGSPVE